MLRLLALPAAVAAVLATSACAAVDRGSETAPPTPDASTQQASETPPAPTASDASEPSGSEPSASGDPGATDEPSASDASGSPAPEAQSSTAAPNGDPGVPGVPQQSGASIDDVLRLGAVASWAERPRLIALSLPASSSCWAFAGEPVVQSPTRIVVQFEQPQRCDRPDGARTYSIAVPGSIDASADLQLAIVGLEHEFTLTLPAE